MQQVDDIFAGNLLINGLNYKPMTVMHYEEQEYFYLSSDSRTCINKFEQHFAKNGFNIHVNSQELNKELQVGIH